MNVLVVCEYSGRTRDAFIRAGFDAISCDFLPTEVPGPHYQGDCRDILNAEDWDLLIAHPDCTYLTCSAEWACWHDYRKIVILGEKAYTYNEEAREAYLDEQKFKKKEVTDAAIKAAREKRFFSFFK